MAEPPTPPPPPREDDAQAGPEEEDATSPSASPSASRKRSRDADPAEPNGAVAKIPRGANPDGSGHSKVNFFFSDLAPQQRKRMRLDEEAVFSVTDCRSAARMTQLLRGLPEITEQSTITDMTSCVGGNVLSFSSAFRRVHAVELDPGRCAMLRHNVETVFGATNVNFHQGNAVAMLLGGHGADGEAAAPADDEAAATQPVRLEQDLLFMDPPWGGTDYRAKDNIHLTLGGLDIGPLVERLRPLAKFVALKLPENFAVDDFERDVTGRVRVVKGFRKMILLIVEGTAKLPSFSSQSSSSSSSSGHRPHGHGPSSGPHPPHGRYHHRDRGRDRGR